MSFKPDKTAIAVKIRGLLRTGIAGLAALAFGMALIASFSFFGSDARATDMPRYEWTATNSAPAAYPVELVRADLELADGGTYYVPDRRVINHGWGKAGATHIVGDALKALPKRLDAVWFSYVENAFYAIKTELPVAAMDAFFKTGIDSPLPGENHAFDRIIFGFGPEGEGAVWLSAHTNTVDVFHFKGRKVDFNWRDMVDNPDISRQDFIAIILQESLGAAGSAATYAPGAWPRRQQRWKWSVEVNSAAKINLLQVHFFNGEALHVLPDIGFNAKREIYAAPHRILLHWTGEGGKKRSGRITFDADETLTAFAKLAATGEALSLIIDISENSNALAVELASKSLILSFEKVALEVYSR